MTKELRGILEDEDWMVYDDGDDISIHKYSDAGEDLFFQLGSSDKEICESLRDIAMNFDPDEHAHFWYGKNKGEPSSLKVLLEDAESIERMLLRLAKKVRDYVSYCNGTL